MFPVTSRPSNFRSQKSKRAIIFREMLGETHAPKRIPPKVLGINRPAGRETIIRSRPPVRAGGDRVTSTQAPLLNGRFAPLCLVIAGGVADRSRFGDRLHAFGWSNFRAEQNPRNEGGVRHRLHERKSLQAAGLATSAPKMASD
ncbi:hypothetical protein SV7mr_49420 [Stieleria bergensis]|uniref:Uncharacterized protein n=1 Tax=Stieleria bergensis TaxID=2528025 RepID=A0A517T1Y0_9BACT|nr:hypothetical protein SV7mr_49420 [Planctomycetes bacterium SV_7m_r]